MSKAANREASQRMSEYMKKHGIVRKSGRCPVCYHEVSIPMDNHFRGGCKRN